MEVPVQRDPKHHGDLARRARSWLVVLVGGIGYGRNEEAVVLQGWPGEGM